MTNKLNFIDNRKSRYNKIILKLQKHGKKKHNLEKKLWNKKQEENLFSAMPISQKDKKNDYINYIRKNYYFI